MSEHKLQRLLDKYGKEEIQHMLALSSGYKERMPTIREFVESPRYLGDLVTVYPFWMDHLERIFPTPYTAPYSTVILFCAIGSGKSTISLIIMLYDMCRLLKLDDPQGYHMLSKVKLLSFALINRTLTLSATVLVATLDQFIMQSPFFKEKTKLKTRKEETFKDIEVVQASRSSHILGADVVTALLSELGFFQTAKQAKEVYDSAQARIESRFMASNQSTGMLAGRLVLDSSPSDEASFLSSGFIKQEKESPTSYVIEGAVWEIKGHMLKFSGEVFSVFIGDDKTDPKIISNDDEQYAHNPRVIKVPIEYKKRFVDDIRVAIQDIAGVCTAATTSFFSSVEKLSACMLLPIEQECLVLHSSDAVEYAVPSTVRDLYIHLDLSLSGDRTGIAISTLSDRLQFAGDGTPIASVDVIAAFAIKAIDKIPLIGIRDWVLSLREHGFTIAQVSADQFQSASILMELQQLGIETKLLSVDTTTEPYENLRYLVGYNRCTLPDSKLLLTELKHLQLTKVNKTSSKNKVDHPEQFEDGTAGSKDIADAVAGSVHACITATGAAPSQEQGANNNLEALLGESFTEPEIEGLEAWDDE